MIFRRAQSQQEKLRRHSEKWKLLGRKQRRRASTAGKECLTSAQYAIRRRQKMLGMMITELDLNLVSELDTMKTLAELEWSL